MELNEFIKIRRRELGLTLKDVAQKLGVAESTILRYESKHIRNMGVDKIVALADVLKCSPDTLMGWNHQPLQTAETAGTVGGADDAKVTINIYESLPAGLPFDANANVIGTQPIPAAWLADGDTYIAYRVKDISMYPRYLEGDLVIAKVTPDCPDGQDALVVADRPEAILRQVHHDRNGALTLTAYNPEYPPKSYRPEGDGVTILGVVREMRRDLPSSFTSVLIMA